VSDTYTKLFSSITESTVWGESYATRIVWIAMLAMADARGNVYGSVPGLARRANVTLSEAQEALAAFYAPDPHSRTKDSDGRRVEEIDGGWRLVNHAKYAAIRSAEERREYKRQWDRENRRRTDSDNPTDIRQNPTLPTAATTPTPTPTPEDQDQKPKAQRAARSAPVVVDVPDWIPGAAWSDFVAHRKALRKPLTQRAAELAIKTLADLRRQGHDPTKVIEQSITSGWTGLFPLRTEGSKHEAHRNLSAVERVREANARARAERGHSDFGDCSVVAEQ